MVRLWPPLRTAGFRTRNAKDRAINFLLLIIRSSRHSFLLVFKSSFWPPGFELLLTLGKWYSSVSSFQQIVLFLRAHENDDIDWTFFWIPCRRWRFWYCGISKLSLLKGRFVYSRVRMRFSHFWWSKCTRETRVKFCFLVSIVTRKVVSCPTSLASRERRNRA